MSDCASPGGFAVPDACAESLTIDEGLRRMGAGSGARTRWNMSRSSPKLADIVRILRSRVIRGTYTGKIPSGRTLARELGASVPTIDLALAELRMLGIVRREARQGTFIVPSDQREKAGDAVTARLVASVPRDLGQWAFWHSVIIFGFERACLARKLSMVLRYVNMNEEADDAVEYAIEAGASGHCVGTCLLGWLTIRHAIALRRAAAPVVAVDWEFEEPLIPSVSFDNLEAGALVAKHLLSLGHKRIAFIGGPQDSPSERDRAKGVEKVLAASGLSPMQAVEYPPEGLGTLARVLAVSPRPTAVVTHTEAIANVLMDQAAAAGIRVPQDLSVASFHDPRCLDRPGLTVAALDFEALGRRAFEALLDDDLWRKPAPRLVAVDRVVGNTTAPPPDAS